MTRPGAPLIRKYLISNPPTKRCQGCEHQPSCATYSKRGQVVELSLDRTIRADRAIADLNTRAFDKLGIVIPTDTIATDLANYKPVRTACLEGHVAVLEPKK